MQGAAQSTVAVFDFDGTLSSRDNVLPFLASVVGRTRVALALVRSTFDVARARRNAVKARLARLLTGLPADELADDGVSFASDCVARHLRADVVERAEWHRAEGHRLVIASASFATYLEPIGSALKFDAVLATRLAVGADGRLTGALDGANVRRLEKVRRLDAWLAEQRLGTPTIWAYGDSAGDRELLAHADHWVRVGRRPISRAPDRPELHSPT
jgi:phosphatidylglycerophosphatase C